MTQMRASLQILRNKACQCLARKMADGSSMSWVSRGADSVHFFTNAGSARLVTATTEVRLQHSALMTGDALDVQRLGEARDGIFLIPSEDEEEDCDYVVTLEKSTKAPIAKGSIGIVPRHSVEASAENGKGLPQSVHRWFRDAM